MAFEKEVEMKFEADENTISKLKNIKLEPYEEVDEYFFTQQTLDDDIYLRFRRKKGKIFLNLKNITLGGKDVEHYEADELAMELTQEQYENLKKIFNIIFPIKILLRKIRSKGFLNDCELCLDNVDELGQFLEIEGPKEKMLEVCKQLNLDMNKNVSKQEGYVKMTMRKRGLL